MFGRLAVPALLSALVMMSVPNPAAAQSFGIGPRLSFVRGDITTATPSTSFTGATMRMSTSRHVALEVALDYRVKKSDDALTRVREVPIQGSLLLFLVRRGFSPYLLGGMGIYSELTDAATSEGFVNTMLTRKTGVHLGFGAEIFLGRHAALFGDYRFRFVKFGDVASGDELIHIPGSSVIPGLDQVKISHHGSMWTSGVAFYF